MKYASGRIATPGPRKPCYLMRLDSALYIGQFDYFIQAFNHWLKLEEREKWFIVPTRRAMNIIVEDNLVRREKWFKLDEPRPLRVSVQDHGAPVHKKRGPRGTFIK